MRSERENAVPELVEGLAPVIPLFVGSVTAPVVARERPEGGGDETLRNRAELSLTKRLRTRQLSVAESRTVLAEQSLDAATIDAVLDRFEELGYLDDATLAEHLVYLGCERKGHGRHVVAQTLAKRGIPRDLADAALAALPDDDAERALEYARRKASGMARLDRETAVRRLAGQLARRGYPGSVALNAAKRALDEAGRSSVRFR